jgi:transposase
LPEQLFEECVDGYPIHRAVKVKKFVASTDGMLRLFFLPPCSPKLKLDESVWNHVKKSPYQQG